MALRHVVSAVVALGATPIGLLVFDYGAGKYSQERLAYFNSSGAWTELATMIVGAGILLVGAAAGRLSGLGPVLAGVVWGLFPFLWLAIDLPSFYDVIRDLPSTYIWFGAAAYEFPLVATLLIGAGLAGRWRGQVDPARSGRPGRPGQPGRPGTPGPAWRPEPQ